MNLILKLWEVVKEDLIAFFALILSGISIVFTLYDFFKKRTKLIMNVDPQKSFYMDAIYTPKGNQESLVLSVDISNRSESPITITDIKLKEHNSSLCKEKKILYADTDLPEEPFSAIKDENGNLEIMVYTPGHGERLLIQNNLITCPIRLEAYGGIKGILLFIEAGSSSGKFKKTEIEFITSRGTIFKKIKVRSKLYNEYLSH